MNIQVLGRDSRGYFYHTGEKSTRNVRIDWAEYDRISAMALAQGVEYRRHSWWTFYTVHFDNGFDYQPVPVAPGRPNSRRVVHVQHLDGTTETDAQWWARQGELADLAATMDAASYRGQ